MSETKFTKGPWTSSLLDYHSDDPTVIAISGSDNKGVCEILDRSVEDADLSFMLAAPDMYDALEVFCSYCFGCTDNECKICIYGNALRKARGETE